jgi:hypothetical protein
MDGQFNEMVASLVEGEDAPQELKDMFQKDLQKYLKNDDVISDQLAKIQDEYSTLMKQNDDEFSKLMDDMNLTNLISRLEELSRLAVELGNVKAATHYNDLVIELQSTLTLDILVANLSKIKNPSKIVDQVKTNFDTEMKKLRTKLGSSRKYYFVDPSELMTVLTAHVQEETAKVFLYSLARFINTKGQERISQYSVFINQLIKNIYALNDETFVDGKVLVYSINTYVNNIKSS